MNKDNYDAYLSNGSLILFCGKHTDCFKNDVLHSTLYANLTATITSNDHELWWQTYTRNLNRMEYPLNSREVRQLEFNNSHLLNIVIESTGSALPEKEQQALSSVFSYLRKQPEDSSAIKAIITRLQANAYNGAEGIAGARTENQSISTATVLTIVRNDKALLTLQISFKTKGGITPGILNEPVLTTIKDGKNNIRLLRSSLNELKYDLIRETVITKLGKKPQTDLLHLAPSALPELQ